MKYSIEIFWFKSDTFFSQTYFKESSMSTPYECSVSCNVIQEPIPLLPSRQTRKNCIPRLPRAAHAGSHVPLLSSDNIQSVPFFHPFSRIDNKADHHCDIFRIGFIPRLDCHCWYLWSEVFAPPRVIPKLTCSPVQSYKNRGEIFEDWRIFGKHIYKYWRTSNDCFFLISKENFQE